MKAKQLPVVVDVVMWNGKNLQELKALADGNADRKHITLGADRKVAVLHSYYGISMAFIGDYVLKNPAGEIQICKADAFRRTYASHDS